MITRRLKDNLAISKEPAVDVQVTGSVGVPEKGEPPKDDGESSPKNSGTVIVKSLSKQNTPLAKKIKVLQCARCGFCSNDEETLASHIKSIHGVDLVDELQDPSKPLQCSECDYSSTNKHCLKQHYDLVHVAERPFKCPFCNYAGKRSHSLKEHLVVHSSTPPYKCSVCNASFRKKGHLTNHVRLHAKKYECKFCQVKLNSEGELVEHMASEHVADDVYICEFCNFCTSVKAVIDKHMVSHGCLPMYGCDDCNFQSADGDKLKEHLDQTKHGSCRNLPGDVTVLMRCAECGFTTQDKECLTNHMIKQHSENGDKNQDKTHEDTDIKKSSEVNNYKCSQCPFTCSKAYSFLSHILSHKAKVPVGAPKANTTPPSSVTRPDPNFTHDAAYGMYRCNICGYLSEHQRSIKTHIWKHSGHQDIDYPMFQNGPLSVYDVTPVGESMLLDNADQQFKVVSLENELEASPVAQNKVPVSVESEDKPTEAAVPPGQLSNKLKRVLQCAWCDFIVGDVPSLEKHLEVSHEIKEKIFLPEDVDLIGDSPNFAVDSVWGPEESQQQDSQSDQADSTSQIVIEPTKEFDAVDTTEKQCQNDPQEGTVVVETENDEIADSGGDKKVIMFQKDNEQVVNEVEIASQDSVIVQCEDPESYDVAFVPMTVEELSSEICKRKGDDLEVGEAKRFCKDEAAICPSESVVVQQLPQIHNVHKLSYQDQEGASLRVASPKLSRASSRESLDEQNFEMPNKPRTRCQSATSQEFVNLLSLLKKGPNYNPACPPSTLKRASTDSERPSESSDAEDSSRQSKKTGICSSLLAVIEQLRERSKSESDGENSQDTTSVSSGGSKKKRSRRTSLENADLENLQNVEHIREEEDGDLVYRCKLCHYSNPSPALIKTHMRLHKTKQPSECSLCDYVAESSEQLQDHMLQHCKVRIYQCKLCPSKFHYKSQLRAHMRAHDKGQYTCKYCSFETTSTMSYRRHLISHSQYSGDCEQIDNDLESVRAKSPSQSENLSPIFKCLKCDKTFVDKEELLSHSHEDQPLQSAPNNMNNVRATLLKCAACDFKTADLDIMKQHAKSHQDYPLKCDMCDFEALSTRSLKSHMKRHANDQRFVQQPLEQYKCNLCGYVCHHLPSLKSHMWRHASDTNYSYQKTNDIINAAIDYDVTPPADVTSISRRPSVEEPVPIPNEPTEQNANNCFVTFRCCQCGFESTQKGELHTHMKEHMDIIQQTMEIPPYPSPEDSTSQA